jgi:predicted ATP-grasp superfamily ATP-dependent carboligase
MFAVITDVKYKMSLAIIRDLVARGINVAVAQSDERGTETFMEPLGFYSKYPKERVWLPNMNIKPEDYLEAIYGLCAKLSQKNGEKCVLIPVGAKTLALLAEPQVTERFREICGLYIPSQAQLDMANDKKQVVALAEKLNIPVPREYSVKLGQNMEEYFNSVPLPCVVKPVCGEKFGIKAKDRYAICHSKAKFKDRFNFFYDLEKDYPIVQEYLAGGGYGISVLAKEGEIIDFICHKRLREYPVTGGPSSCCMRVKIDILEGYAKKMIKAMDYSGIAMLEFKTTKEGEDGIFKMLEINPRVWGSYNLTRIAQTNFSYNWFALGYNMANPEKAIHIEPSTYKWQTKMIYGTSDKIAVIGYAKAGKLSKVFGGIADMLNPKVKDGIKSKGDNKPARVYFKSLFVKAKNK